MSERKTDVNDGDESENGPDELSNYGKIKKEIQDAIQDVTDSNSTYNYLTKKSSLVKQSSSISSYNARPFLPWDRFSFWVNSIMVVTFDIEMGQSIESIYPSAMQAKLSNNDKINICYMSFPDSNSGFIGDTQFHFRFKLDNSTQNSHNINNLSTNFNNNLNLSSIAHHNHNRTCSNLPSLNSTKFSEHSVSHNVNYDEYNSKTLSGLEVDKNHMFGYVYFRQVKDKSLKRGYFQKSVVLLSKFPFVSLFNYIVSLIANEYFSTGVEVIETACHDIEKWPLAIPGEMISLPILGHLIEVSLPFKIDRSILPIIYKKDFPSVPVNLPPIHEVNLYKAFQPILPHIHILWELILLNETNTDDNFEKPIVVIANVPSVCSELVQALISLIFPLKYSSDYRPFFTIHNTEFSEYSTKDAKAPPVVVGVTNPFFTKCFQHWPNIIKISENSKNLLNETQNYLNRQSNSSPTDFKKSPKIKKTTNIKVVDSKPSIYTKYEPCLKKDKDILKNLIKGSETNRPHEAQTTILRRHFFDLTQKFMIPLERYFSSLMPLLKNISPLKKVPDLRNFDSNEFIQNLKSAAPEIVPNLRVCFVKKFKFKPVIGLVFTETQNFKYWLKTKQKEAEIKLELLHLEIICDYDIKSWLKNRQEVEIIDQYMNVKNKLDMIENCKLDANEQVKSKLRSILRLFVNSLPEDMRSILNKT